MLNHFRVSFFIFVTIKQAAADEALRSTSAGEGGWQAVKGFRALSEGVLSV